MGTNDSGPIRVGVLGVAGRMGRAVADAVHEADGLMLVAAADPSAPGSEVNDVTVAAGVEDLLDAVPDVDVVVDFTVAEASRATLPALAAAGVHAVVGTSGLDDDDLAALRDVFRTSNCLVAPNFAIGAVLMMRFAELAAPWFETAEIVETHHDGKIDAPAGTAVAKLDPKQRSIALAHLGAGSASGGSQQHRFVNPGISQFTAQWISDGSV